MPKTKLDWDKLLCTDRRIPSPKLKVDHRTEFERDYDRALFSTPVRRLQDKAQVFPLESNDSIRTRLTHSLEVASIARTLGQRCAPFIIKSAKLLKARNHDIELLCQTAGLLHDIGNPPFGHAGEEAIANWFKGNQGIKLPAKGRGKRSILKNSLHHGVTNKAQIRQRILDFKKFDGNSQAFRIVTRLQHVDNEAGLNLTYATLAVLLKYTAGSHQCKKSIAHLKKHGFFCSENDIVTDVRKKAGLGRLRHPLTYLVEAADDIAYSVIDIEDALKKGVLSWKDLCRLAEHEFKPLIGFIEEAREIVDDCMKSDGSNKASFEREREYAYMTKLRSLLITAMVDSIQQSFQSNYTHIMNGSLNQALEEKCDRKDVIFACKEITRKYVYFAKETLKLEIMGRKVVSDLMNLFWEGVIHYDANAKSFHFPNKICELLSTNYRYAYEKEIKLLLGTTVGVDYHAALHLVTDHICGMTDTYACRIHKELFNSP